MCVRSEFQIVDVKNGIVFIRDMNKGRLTVTNDAENVVRFVHKTYKDKRMVYLDTMGVWSELRHDNGTFTGSKPYNGWVPFKV